MNVHVNVNFKILNVQVCTRLRMDSSTQVQGETSALFKYIHVRNICWSSPWNAFVLLGFAHVNNCAKVAHCY